VSPSFSIALVINPSSTSSESVDEIRLSRRPDTGPKENPCVRTPNQVRTHFYVGSRPQHSEFVAAERYKETITRRLGCRESADYLEPNTPLCIPVH